MKASDKKNKKESPALAGLHVACEVFSSISFQPQLIEAIASLSLQSNFSLVQNFRFELENFLYPHGLNCDYFLLLPLCKSRVPSALNLKRNQIQDPH
ncbi:hypothetical protein SAMN03080615_02880 [Amphritea atlantica]|uniref:Uncharacterized protein n=1 Tax=Amphritea atlantica TaxID=355243 RepID=A0A1H9J5J7_9GAMM|nr:hypothetical protein [Amphritea atlantica]SEQ82037.1 hypothetical protein SAMN03080615_02880 [Amphritea atlantica]